MGAATITPCYFDFSQALDVALLMMTMPREEMCSVMIMAIIALCVMLMLQAARDGSANHVLIGQTCRRLPVICATSRRTPALRGTCLVLTRMTDSRFRHAICYECVKGEKGNWMVPVEGYGLRRVLRSHQC